MIHALFAAVLQAGTTESCHALEVGTTSVVTLNIPADASTHLIFDRHIASHVPYEQELWKFDNNGGHFFIRPNKSLQQSNTTIVFDNGDAIDLRFRLSGDTNCYQFDTGVTGSSEFGIVSRPTTRPVQSAGSLALPQVASTSPAGGVINSNYSYTAPVTTVYDDGRFTTIRIDTSQSLEGAVLMGPGNSIITYDAAAVSHAQNTITVSGVYPSFTVMVGGHDVVVTRE